MIKYCAEGAILTLGGAYGVEDGGESPVYCDEVRPGPNIEIKHKPKVISEENVSLQLRANMMLTLARELDQILMKDSLSNLKSLNTMTIYGVTFGYHTFHLIMKLSVSFGKRTTETSVRFAAQDSEPWAIDASISYVLSRMKANSTVSPSPGPEDHP